MNITHIHAREVLDSRGNPTVEADVTLEGGVIGRAIVPSGASTGTHEAHELRDDDPERYGGKGVLRAVKNVNTEIRRAIIGMKADNQEGIDTAMISLDGTKEKSRLGANAILAVSLAAAHAASHAKNTPLYEHIRSLSNGSREYVMPLPQCNVINGGAHTNWETTDIQEFMIAPVSAETFRDAVRMLSEIFHSLKKILSERGYATAVGDEGGFAPQVRGGNEEAFGLITEAVDTAGYAMGADIVFTPDIASSELRKDALYVLPLEKKRFSSDEMIVWYESLKKKYPISSIEDGLAEDDWEGWKKLTAGLGDSTQLVGDDLLVTNTDFLERAIEEKAGNAILIKVNQIGTLTETIRAVEMAQKAGWGVVMSHRSGETEDTTIAHLAVGLGTGQIKTGSMSRSDRIAKYNELLRIEETLSDKARFVGKNALS